MTIAPMTEEHAQSICNWRYPAPYDIYNWPSWEKMKKNGIEFGDPVLRAAQYQVVLGTECGLLGYAQYFPLGNTIRIGLGMNPVQLGRRLGAQMARTIAYEARRRAPGNEIDLEVASWNIRAIRTYLAAGFTIEDTYTRPTPEGETECHCMVYTH